jgi:hypothetical protein
MGQSDPWDPLTTKSYDLWDLLETLEPLKFAISLRNEKKKVTGIQTHKIPSVQQVISYKKVTTQKVWA